MQPFTRHTGIVVTMDRVNVDTDQIIPKQFLKRIERSGFGQYLFNDWRFQGDGLPCPDFEFNRADVAGCSVLVARRNFGCGSSREHAVWALADFGIRALIAPTFADIFYNNCFKNGLLPIQCDESVVEEIFQAAAAHPGYQMTIDLEQSRLSDQLGLSISFQVDEFRRDCLLNGWDDIAMTLQHADKIAAYEATREI